MSQDVIKEFQASQKSITLELERGPHNLNSATGSGVLMAQDFLWSARLAVENAISAAFVTRNLGRVARGQTMAGNMGDSEQDLLRAALVFASAGLDASLKRLVIDSLGPLVAVDERVRDGLHGFAERHLSGGQANVDPATLVRVLMADEVSPRQVLITSWRDDVIAGSLQSVDKVNEICTVLGVVDPTLRKRIATNRDTLLRQAFVARNEIVHELDLQERSRGTDSIAELQRRKRRRGAAKMTEWATEILSVSQIIIDHVATALVKRTDVPERGGMTP